MSLVTTQSRTTAFRCDETGALSPGNTLPEGWTTETYWLDGQKVVRHYSPMADRDAPGAQLSAGDNRTVTLN